MYTVWSRRAFLRMTLLSAAAWSPLARATFAFGNEVAPGRDVLVTLFLRGGLDGLSAVVPAFEPRYYDLRPRSAVPEAELVPLDGRFGLHPELAPLADLYHAGTLAVVHAVGNVNPTRSHFEAQESMEAGTPDPTETDGGWIGRHLAIAGPSGSAFQAVALEPRQPASLHGGVPVLVTPHLSAFRLRAAENVADRYTGALWSLYESEDEIGAAGRIALGTLSEAAVIEASPSQAEYPPGDFGVTLATIGKLVRAEVGLEAVTLSFDGFDTHADMAPRLAPVLAELSGSLRAFVDDLGPDLARVTLVVMSEFGRRIAENGSRGTDHGRASCMLALGGGIRGGAVYGPWPTLAESALDRGDLAVATDYRDVLAEIVTARLGNDRLDLVFPGLAHVPLGLAIPR